MIHTNSTSFCMTIAKKQKLQTRLEETVSKVNMKVFPQKTLTKHLERKKLIMRLLLIATFAVNLCVKRLKSTIEIA